MQQNPKKFFLSKDAKHGVFTAMGNMRISTARGKDASGNESRWASGFWLELGAFFLKKRPQKQHKSPKHSGWHCSGRPGALAAPIKKLRMENGS